MTHTYAILEVSKTTFEEVSQALKKAGYDHVFHEDGDGKTVIDMRGLALREGSVASAEMAQERMYGIRARIDSIKLLIVTAGKEYEAAVEESRSVLKVFPSLSLGRRPQ